MHAAEAVSSPLSIVSLGDVGGGGGVTDRATRGACSAGRDSQMHYLTGPETTVRQHPVTPPDLCGVEPLRDGQAHCCKFHWLIVKNPVVQEGRGL